MASRNSNAQTQNTVNQQRRTRTEAYAQQVKAEYAQAVDAILALQKKLPQLDPGVMYSFDGDSPKVRREVDKVLRNLYAANMTTIKTGIASEWETANKEVDKLITSAVGKKALKNPQLAGWFARNEEALETFTNRSENGMNLSDRVWKNAQQFRDEMEIAMTVAIGEGQSASQMSRRVRQYLDDPDLMFRRFRYKDEDGNWRLKWKKRVQTDDGHFKYIDYDRDSYKTGAGVYKSSYKNAMRVTRTETNMAYRRADHDRWQNLEFVLGQNITPSKSHDPEEDKDVCDQLQGKYPKDFVFEGWHPQCMCSCTAIMVSEDEMQERMAARLRGEDYQFKEKPVTTYPEGFQKFVQENKDNILGAQAAGKLPYFLRENYSLVEQVFNGVDITDPQSFATQAQTATAEDIEFIPATLEDLEKEYGVRWGYAEKLPREAAAEALSDGIGSKFDFMGVKKDLQTMFDKYGLERMRSSVHFMGKDEFSITFTGRKNGEEVFELTRTIVKEEGQVVVRHNVVFFDKSIQGQGIAKETFRIFHEQYKRMDVDTIRISANNDVGGYAWARYGFQADNKRWAVRALDRNGIDPDLRKKALDFVDEYYADKDDHYDPFPMSLLVDRFGKENAKKLLLGSRWDGTINFKDKEQRATLEKYLGLTQDQPKPQLTPQEIWEQAKKEYSDALMEKEEEALKADWIWKYDFNGMNEGLKGLSKKYGFTLDHSKIEIDGDYRLTVTYSSRANNLIRRTFRNKEREGGVVVSHDLFKLDTQYQGTGLSKEVFREFYAQYREMGVVKIQVHANLDVGGYTWARYGFSATKKGALDAINYYNAADETLRGRARQIVEDYYQEKGVAWDARFPMNRLVEKLGKEDAKKVLLQSDWAGEIDLTDANQRGIFEKYMGWQPQTAPSTQPSTLEKVRARQAARTPEQIEAIKRAWKVSREINSTITEAEKSMPGATQLYRQRLREGKESASASAEAVKQAARNYASHTKEMSALGYEKQRAHLQKVIAEREAYGGVIPQMEVAALRQRLTEVEGHIAKGEHRDPMELKAARQAMRTEAQKESIQKRWNATLAEHQEIRDNAAKTLTLAGEFKELDASKLQNFTKDGNLTQMRRQTALLDKEIKAAEAEEKKLADLIPDVHQWHKDFTITQLQGVYDATKKNLDKWDSLSLEDQLKKLTFEAEDFLGGNMKGVQQKYSTWQVSQAVYRKRIDSVNYKIAVKEVEDKLAPIKQWVDSHPKAAKVANLYNAAADAIAKGESLSDIKKKTQEVAVVYGQRVASENAKAKKNTGGTQTTTSSTNPFTADAYKQERKDNALWAKKVKDADDMVRDVCGEVWRNATQKQRQAIYEYTYEYCNTNEPLRGLTFIGNAEKAKRGVDKVTPMTEIIGKSSYKHDMWLQRGGSYKDLKKFGINASSTGEVTPQDMKDLVGRTGTDGGFMSTAVSKGEGFDNHFIFNIYAPAGTKMMYLEPFSQYGNGAGKSWDGVSKQKTFGEAEMLLQRGTTLRITKVEYANGHWYIDAEVVAQKVVKFPYKGGYPFDYK